MSEQRDNTALAATAAYEKPKKEKKPRKPRKLLKSEEWAAEVSKGQDAIAAIKAALDQLEPEFLKLTGVFEALTSHKDDYSERLGNIPESLQEGENAERLRAIDEIELDDGTEDFLAEWHKNLTALEEQLAECENADLPKN